MAESSAHIIIRCEIVIDIERDSHSSLRESEGDVWVLHNAKAIASIILIAHIET